MKPYLTRLLDGQHLSKTEIYTAFSNFETQIPVQQSSFLSLLSVKGYSYDELLGAYEYLIQYSNLFESNCDAIDIVGTGGDEMGTFNISTASSLVVASCGVDVVKHGGRSVSSKAGSADVMDSLGMVYCQHPKDVILQLTQHGYAYLLAPYFNDFLQRVSPLRRSLKFATIFNALGPLLNPCQPKRQLIGVYRKDLIEPCIQILKSLGSKRALVVHSKEGLDEISVSSNTHVCELDKGKVRSYTLSPADFGMTQSNLMDVCGSNAEGNANLIENIFQGREKGACLDIVLVNSAAGLWVAGYVSSFVEGVAMAKDAINTGQTLSLLQKMQRSKG
jgi:anthranilate phosphoribosyltransferase